MKQNSESKLFLGIIVVTVAVIGAGMIFFSKPSPVIPRDKLISADTPTKGLPTAKTYLVKFSDFQCPSCLTAKPFVDDLINKYPDQLLFVYRHFPLSQHPFSRKAALSSIAAADQNKFWEMYEYLFANQEKLSDKVIASAASELKLDLFLFETSAASPSTTRKLEADIQVATSLGVSYTPTFFLNGKKLNLVSFSDLTKEVEKAIQK